MASHLAAQVLWVLGGGYALLIVASLVQWAMQRRRPERDLGELRSRIRSWWVMVTLFTAAMLLSPTASVVFFAFVSFLAFKEYLSIIPTRRADRRVLFWAYLAIPVQYAWVGAGQYGLFIVFIPVYVFLLLPHAHGRHRRDARASCARPGRCTGG